MELTGKAKKDFEEWYLESYYLDVDKGLRWVRMLEFYGQPKSMQYGVYVDWFDSVELYIEISNLDPKSDWGYVIDDCEPTSDGYIEWDFNTRTEARIKAIKKANQIYNDTK